MHETVSCKRDMHALLTCNPSPTISGHPARVPRGPDSYLCYAIGLKPGRPLVTELNLAEVSKVPDKYCHWYYYSVNDRACNLSSKFVKIIVINLLKDINIRDYIRAKILKSNLKDKILIYNYSIRLYNIH